MLRTRVIPCLLLRGNSLVKTINFKKPRYVGDAINTVRIFNEREVDELFVLDIEATRQKREPNYSIISSIASECFMPLAYGGGISSLQQAKRIFDLGVEKISLNAINQSNIEIVWRIAQSYGSQSVVASVDVKKNWLGRYRVFDYINRKLTNLDPVLWSQKMERQGAGEIFLTSIDQEGAMKGYDLSLVRAVSHSVQVPVVSCGGAAGIHDFVAAVHNGASAVSAGSCMVYQGINRSVLINYPSREELNMLEKS